MNPSIKISRNQSLSVQQQSIRTVLFSTVNLLHRSSYNKSLEADSWPGLSDICGVSRLGVLEQLPVARGRHLGSR